MHNINDKRKQKNQYSGDTHQAKKNNAVVNRSEIFLITVNVLGSAGPMRFLVNESDVVATVIDTALKTFAREGRLPVLGFHVDNFLLYCANEGSDAALSPSERIGQSGGRNFLLCKKQQLQQPQNQMMATDEQGSAAKTMNNKNAEKGSGWKAWIINKSLSFKLIIPHCH